MQWGLSAHHHMQTFLWERLNQQIFIGTSDKAITYLRYVDDLLFIWKGTEEELLSLKENLNEKHTSIQFDFKYSKTEIEFLDTKIYNDTNGKRCAAIYLEPTNRPNYLHSTSAYAPSLRKSIP